MATITLYHGTNIQAAQSIVRNGFQLTEDDYSNCNRDVKDAVIYGFDNFSDAEDFSLNQGYENQAVVEFDVDEDELNEDPEYGEGAFYLRVFPRNVRLKWTHDAGEEVCYE